MGEKLEERPIGAAVIVQVMWQTDWRGCDR